MISSRSGKFGPNEGDAHTESGSARRDRRARDDALAHGGRAGLKRGIHASRGKRRLDAWGRSRVGDVERMSGGITSPARTGISVGRDPSLNRGPSEKNAICRRSSRSAQAQGNRTAQNRKGIGPTSTISSHSLGAAKKPAGWAPPPSTSPKYRYPAHRTSWPACPCSKPTGNAPPARSIRNRVWPVPNSFGSSTITACSHRRCSRHRRLPSLSAPNLRSCHHRRQPSRQ